MMYSLWVSKSQRVPGHENIFVRGFGQANLALDKAHVTRFAAPYNVVLSNAQGRN